MLIVYVFSGSTANNNARGLSQLASSMFPFRSLKRANLCISALIGTRADAVDYLAGNFGTCHWAGKLELCSQGRQHVIPRAILVLLLFP